MTTERVHVFRREPAVARLLFADRNPAESAIALRAFKRLASGSLESWPATTLAEAAEVLAHQPINTVVAGSALDGLTVLETIGWFAHRAHGSTIIAMLEQGGERQRQDALDAGASCVCSKPDLLVSQLRQEFASRGSDFPERPRRMG